MYKYLIFTALFALCSAKPGNIGLGYGGHGIAAPVAIAAHPIAVAAHPVAVAPVSINSGISSQSRIDYRTPVATSIAIPTVATSIAVPTVATSAYGIGNGNGYGLGGIEVGNGYGLGSIGVGNGYGLGGLGLRGGLGYGSIGYGYGH